MHGRLKVRTTEEERERKKKEQALKVKAYKAATAKISVKRQNHEYDDEMLAYTTPILQRNPDVSTLWNIRRECILAKMKKIQEEDDIPDENAESKEDRILKVLETEISLTEQCLLVNPKSYNIWHHRMWLLEQSPKANWQREVMLCNKYLKMDERNFHTWDYKRYVVEKAQVPKEEELDFCTEKIKVNFSNYSSWHHRSLLLPALYPYEGDAKPKRPMSEEKLKEELEMVLTAAFTDPYDSSAWFYQRWLLGYSQPELAVCAFRCSKDKTVLSFTKPTTKEELKVLLTGGGQTLEITDFQTLNNQVSDTSFYSKTQEENPSLYTQLEVTSKALKTITLPLSKYNDDIYYFQPLEATTTYTPDVLDQLKSQLESCESLLEYEPDSKWCLLTSALLMRAIDCNGYHDKTMEYLKKLQKVDSLRENYYKDLASKWILQKALIQWSKTGENMLKSLDLSQENQLTCLTDKQYLIVADEIILSEELTKRYGELKSFINI
ncbi:geranylgeranyl transferase type-2 subunit alpha-like [Musca vetustissima]|uniref:geranylgeranyl transferase type-2 subunit alpha-like n=1 Tax=Musca vetustissima TaxID=27455 RepID=UPI002AB6C6B0|nr:geranylgeranyl transferase type-2 subunit alpha-like [Musca vetustissima]